MKLLVVSIVKYKTLYMYLFLIFLFIIQCMLLNIDIDTQKLFICKTVTSSPRLNSYEIF